MIINNYLEKAFAYYKIKHEPIVDELTYRVYDNVKFNKEVTTKNGLEVKTITMGLGKFISSIVIGNTNGSTVYSISRLLKSMIEVKSIEIHDNVNYVYANSGKCSSCMTNSKSKVHFYNRIGVKSIVTIGHDDKIRSRALLWDKVKIEYPNTSDEDYMFMDRVYGLDVELLHLYAKDNNFLYKDGYSIVSGKDVVCVSKQIDKNLIYKTPYIDTLNLFDYKSSKLYNESRKKIDIVYNCRTTDNVRRENIEDDFGKDVDLFDKKINRRNPVLVRDIDLKPKVSEIIPIDYFL